MWTPCATSTFVLCLSHDAFKTLCPTRTRLTYYSYKLYTCVSICENMPLPLLIHLPSTFHSCVTHSLFRWKVLWGKGKYYLSGADWWGKEPKDAAASPQTAWGKDHVYSSLMAGNYSHLPYLTRLMCLHGLFWWWRSGIRMLTLTITPFLKTFSLPLKGRVFSSQK